MAESSDSISFRSFSDFYFDEDLPGHFLLAPSIFVGRAYTWIFYSDLKENGWDPLISLIARIALFIILPILAILSALFIPLGLVWKLIANQCCTPLKHERLPDIFITPTNPRVKPPITTITRAGGSSNGGTITPPPPLDLDSVDTQDPPVEPALPPEPSDRRSSLAREIQEANENLQAAESALNVIQSKKLDLAALQLVETRLDNPQLKSLLCTIPNKGEANDPIVELSNRERLLAVRIKSIKDHHYFRTTKMGEEGEIVVDDNGDCLFASFIQSGLDVSMDGETIAAERKEALEWILVNYVENKELQRHLVNSLAEHYHTKIERLQQESENLTEILANSALLGAGDTLDAKKRLEAIPQEIDLLYTEIIPKITQAIGEAHTGTISFGPISDLVPDYLAELSQKGVHGGAAELFALSCRHQVCIKIYRKAGSTIEKVPYEIMNAEWETTETPARQFTHTLNHYNSYFPT